MEVVDCKVRSCLAACPMGTGPRSVVWSCSGQAGSRSTCGKPSGWVGGRAARWVGGWLPRWGVWGAGGSRTREESGASSGRKAGLGELDAGLALAHRTLAPSMIRLTVVIIIIMIMMALSMITFTFDCQ